MAGGRAPVGVAVAVDAEDEEPVMRESGWRLLYRGGSDGIAERDDTDAGREDDCARDMVEAPCVLQGKTEQG